MNWSGQSESSEQRIPYAQMRPYVELTDGTVVHADRSVPQA